MDLYSDAMVVDVVVAVAANVVPLVDDQRLQPRPLANLLTNHAAGKASSNNCTNKL